MELAPRLSRALPQPVLDLGPEELMLILRDPERRAALKRDVEEDHLPGAGYAGLLRHHAFDRIVVFFAPSQLALTGRSISSIAAERGADPFDTFLDLILEEDDRVVGIFDYIEQDNIRALLTHRLSMCCSDGLVMPPVEQLDRSLYWPCSYGEYPGILERYVRDEPLLSLEDAVRRMTSFPAQRFGLHDRGVLRPGLVADIVVFDLDRIRDRATNPFPHGAPLINVPHGYPEGIDYVLINGCVVIEDGAHTGAVTGRVLCHRAG
jgi:N-acyl-D-aspartate/D-glutamate deacylase